MFEDKQATVRRKDQVARAAYSNSVSKQVTYDYDADSTISQEKRKARQDAFIVFTKRADTALEPIRDLLKEVINKYGVDASVLVSAMQGFQSFESALRDVAHFTSIKDTKDV